MPLYGPPPIEYFSAIPASAQTGIATGTPTKVLFETVQSNIGARFATGTSLATLPPGRAWLLTAGVFVTGGLTAASRLTLAVLINGAANGRFLADVVAPASGTVWVGGSIIVNPNGETYGVSINGYTGSSFDLYNGGEGTYFTGAAL